MRSPDLQLRRIATILLIASGSCFASSRVPLEHYQSQNGSISLTQHDFKQSPSISISGMWRQLTQNKDRTKQNKQTILLNPDTVFFDKIFALELGGKPNYQPLLMVISLPEERPDLVLKIQANPAIRAVRLMEVGIADPIYEYRAERDFVMQELAIPIAKQGGSNFQLLLIADSKMLRNSFQSFAFIIYTPPFEPSLTIKSDWSGLKFGTLLLLLMFFAMIFQIEEFRSEALNSMITIAIICGLAALKSLPWPMLDSLGYLNFSWLIRYNAFLGLSGVILFAYQQQIGKFPLQLGRKKNIYLTVSLLLFFLTPLGVVTSLALYAPIIVCCWLLLLAINSSSKRIPQLSKTFPLLLMAAGALADWRQIAFAESWLISMEHGLLLALCWQSKTSLQQVINIFHYKKRRFQLQSSYLNHLFALLRKDIAKAMLIKPADSSNVEYDSHHLLRKLTETQHQLAKAACIVEKADASLHRDPINPGQDWGQFSAQEVFEDAIATIGELIRPASSIHLKASHNWSDHGPRIYTDRLLLNYVLYEAVGNLFNTLDNQYKSVIDLNMHFERDHQLFFVTLNIQQQPHTSENSRQQSPIWRSDLGQAEENFSHCIEFCQRLLQNLNGKLNLKRPSFMEKIIEIELPIVNRIPQLLAPRHDQRISRNILAQAAQLADHASKYEPNPIADSSQYIKALLLGETQSSYITLKTCLEQASIELIWVADLVELESLIKANSIKLILIHYEYDNQTVEKILHKLRSSIADVNIAIIVMTTDRNINNQLRLIPMQLDDFILLPLSADELLIRVSSSLKRLKTIWQAHQLMEQRNLAEDFQKILLSPTNQLPGIHIEGRYLAADTTSGDWYQTFYDRRHHRLFAIVGDVAGRGRRAALIATTANGAFRALTQSMSKKVQALSLDRCLWDLIEGVNQAIYEAANHSQRTMTVTFIALDLNSGDLLYSNAGGGPIYITNDHQCESVLIGGRPLGLTKQISLNYRRMHLSPHSAIFLSTDGLLRNQGPDGQSLSQRQLIQLLTKAGHEKSQQIADSILLEAKSIWKDHALADDVVVLVIYWFHATNPLFLDEESA